jgi:uncharacterized protein YndB with AHSA1/START domain
MSHPPEPALLLIADISGYTGYLAGVELDHAQDILADLMDTVVHGLRPPFRLAKLEGDAAFAWLGGEHVDGSALQDTVEGTYLAFRRRVRDIERASRCECNACIRIPNLDLKLVVHHGTVLRHKVAGREELLGAPVIVVHRLLKNAVAEATGLSAYAMYTDAAIVAAGIDADGQGLVRHVEPTDVAGDVTTWLRDLEAAWQEDLARTRIEVVAGDAVAAVEATLDAPREIVWEWVTAPEKRPLWQMNVTGVDEATESGRRGVGTVNHCMHGRDAFIEELVDWRPFDYFTLRLQIPAPGFPKLLMTYAMEPVDGGTRYSIRIGRPASKKDLPAMDGARALLEHSFEVGIAALRPLLAADVASRVADGTEPATPASAGRFLSEPVESAAARTSPS